MTTVVSPSELSNFRTGIRAIAPPWLVGWVGDRYLWTIGVVMDATLDGMAWGTFARFPKSGITGALVPLGDDRKIDRGPSEPDASYASRLKKFRTVWKYAGAARTLLSQLQALFLPSVPPLRLVFHNKFGLGSSLTTWYEIDATTLVTWDPQADPNWNWGDTVAPQRWWRFWVVVPASAGGWTSWAYGSGPTFGDGHTYGSTATVAEVQNVLNVIRKWTPPHCFCDTVIVPFIGTLFTSSNPTATAGNYTDPVNRNPNAAYWTVTP